MKYRNLTFIVYGIILVCALSNSLMAQDVESIKADHKTYIWGIGSGATLKAADQAALADIIGQISTQVESSFERTVTETESTFKEIVNDVVKTYSNATLKNTERIVLHDEPDAKVFRYIKRSEIAKIFESRKNKIIDLAHYGELALKNIQIADALRYFYWAQTLLRSHPESMDIKMTCEAGKEVLLITWLPIQINQIFSNLSFNVEKIDNKESYSNYILDIRYKAEPVLNFDYTYWSGQDWSNIVSAKDGIGVVELSQSENSSEIRLKTEYTFEGEANIDLELRDVIQKLPQVPYKNSYYNISKTNTTKPTIKTESETKTEREKTSSKYGTVQALLNQEDKDAIIQKVLSTFTTKDYSKIQSNFTEEGYSIFQSLLLYGNAKILKSFVLKYYQYGDYVICRSIPMSFRFKTNDRTFIEDVVFYFDKENKICNITFSLSQKAVEDIASNDSWSEEIRVLLMCFLENYKTAFSLKRYEYINKIFSDDALIITGLVNKVNTVSENKYFNNNIVQYNRQSKSDYMKKLKYSFESKEFINIRFTENSIRRSNKVNDVYGIQIKQDYFSSNYGDSGYLFLLIDISDSKTPLIHIRTWQPEKNSDGSIYGLSDF